MDNLNQKAGFLKGLLANIDESTDPQIVRVLQAMADDLSALTERINAHDVLLNDLNDYVESIDDDLAVLEGDSEVRFDSRGDITEPADIVPFSREMAKDEEEKDEPVETENYAGRICPDCSSLFLVSSADAADAKYRCPSCGSIVVPLMLTPETVRPVRPEE